MQNNTEMFAILYGLGGLVVGGLLLAVFSWACKIIDKELFYDTLKKQTEESHTDIQPTRPWPR